MSGGLIQLNLENIMNQHRLQMEKYEQKIQEQRIMLETHKEQTKKYDNDENIDNLIDTLHIIGFIKK